MTEKKYFVFILNRTKTRKFNFVYCSNCGYIIDTFEKKIKKGDNNCCNCDCKLDWSIVKNFELKVIK